PMARAKTQNTTGRAETYKTGVKYKKKPQGTKPHRVARGAGGVKKRKQPPADKGGRAEMKRWQFIKGSRQ
ncbi:hypothetical protein RA267_28250, partial [Pseudomonas syringae pv. tagetis]|uniref:hypothetical protein n=1 Tax=Pseudomonas syringae group genomosp. 7 TaxID=251699 RepID=UPI00376FA9C6